MGQLESVTIDDSEIADCSVLNGDRTLHGIAEAIKCGKVKKICILAGAGISCSAGIPDFRSPNTGIYHNLQAYNLPNPEAMFEIEYFKEHPSSFYDFMKVRIVTMSIRIETFTWKIQTYLHTLLL